MSDASATTPDGDTRDPVSGLLQDLAEACRRVLAESVPDPTATREVARRLGLSTTNAWRFVRLAQDGATAKSLQSMPGPRAWAAMLSALEDRGGAPSAIEPLRLAVARLYAELDRRGLSRSDLPRFARADGGELPAIDRARETRTNALLWGASAGGMATSYLVRIDPGTGRPLVIGVSTFAGLRRIRPGPEWCLPTPDRVLFADRRAVPFASEPRIEVDAASLVSDDARAELGRSAEGHIAFRGQHATTASPIDLAVSAGGLVAANEASGSGVLPAIFAAPIWIPTAEFVLEVLFERSSAPPGDPHATIYAQIGSNAVADVDRHHFVMGGSASIEVLSKDERCRDLAPPFDNAARAGRTLHAAAISQAIAAMGLEPHDFVRHRCVVANPVLCTMVELGWLPA
ncbi:MAG: hypothetical protein ACO3Y3_02725 [Phycisphaerales bacterium]